MTELDEIYDVVADILIQEMRARLISQGKLKKTGGLVDSIEEKITRGQLDILVNDYYEYYVKGRRPLARKVPITALIKWIKRYRFKIGRGRDKRGRFISDNSLAFAIQTSIYKRGIKKKEDVVAIVLKQNESTIDKLIEDKFFEEINEELDRIFES